MKTVFKWVAAALFCIFVWDAMRRIDGIPSQVTDLLLLMLLSGAFVLLFIGAFKSCWTGLTKEPEPAKGGDQKKKGDGGKKDKK